MLFDNQNILVTGASMGLGEELAKQFAQEGAKVILCARSIDKLQILVDEIKAEGGKAEAFQLDVTSDENVASVFDQVKQKYAYLDLLVNNAGALNNKGFEDGKLGDYLKLQRVNVEGYMRVALQFLPIVGREIQKGKNTYRKGKVILVSSLGGEIIIPQMQFYSITKATTRAIAAAIREYFKTSKQKFMKVLDVNPMQFDSEIFSNDEGSQGFAQKMAAKGMLPSSAEIAHSIVKEARKARDRDIYVPFLARFTHWFYRLSPRITIWLVRKIIS